MEFYNAGDLSDLLTGFSFLQVFGLNFLVDGFCGCFGVLMNGLLNQYEVSTLKASLISSIMIGCYLLEGLLTCSCDLLL